MGKNIYLTIGGGAQNRKNAICEGWARRVLCIFYTHITDLPEIESPVAMSLMGEETKHRQWSVKKY